MYHLSAVLLPAISSRGISTAPDFGGNYSAEALTQPTGMAGLSRLRGAPFLTESI